MTAFVKKSNGQVLTAQDYNGNLEHGYWGGAIYDADVGGDDTYVATIDPVPTSYNLGMTIKLKVATGNTGAASLNVNSLGVIAIKKNVADDLETGDVLANQIITVKYDGTNFQLVESTNQVKVSGDDTTLGYLFSKIAVVAGKIIATVLNGGANETIQFDVGADIFDKVDDNSDDIIEGSTNLFVGVGTVNTTALKTATGSTSGSGVSNTNITMNDYSFGQNIYMSNPIFAIGGFTSSNADQIARFAIIGTGISPGTTNYAIRWRYVNSSDPKHWIYALLDSNNIISVWESEDHCKGHNPFGELKENQELIIINSENIEEYKINARKNKQSISQYLIDNYELDVQSVWEETYIIEHDEWDEIEGENYPLKYDKKTKEYIDPGFTGLKKVQLPIVPNDMKYYFIKQKGA